LLQAEAELAQQTPGRIASSSAAGSPVIIPRLPHNPTRVDRLYVESLREHSKVHCRVYVIIISSGRWWRFSCMLPMAVAHYCSVVVTIRYVLPVLWWRHVFFL